MRSILDLWEKIKGIRGFKQPRLRQIPDDLFLALIIMLVAFGSFGLGRLSKIEASKTPIRIENAPAYTADTFIPSTTTATDISSPPQVDPGTLVGSKNGTKYYYSWCSGAQNILPANLIHFTSKADAEARGYMPSTTCKGL